MKNELLLISIASDSHRNIGCLSLYASAVHDGISTNLLFIPRVAEYSEREFAQYLADNAFKVVGISLTTRDYYFARTVTAHVRKHLPGAHIVWGGIHPTSKPGECLDHADSLCLGEGEVFLPELVRTLRAGRDISRMPGIGIRTNGENIITPPALIEDLNALPFPRFHFEHFRVLDGTGLHQFGPPDYVRYARHNGDGYVLLTSRSCPHRCSYCINSFLNRLYTNNVRRLYRRRTVDDTLAEISHALATIPGIGFINFMDDHFLTDEKWLVEFCEKYRRDIRLPFIIRATPGTVKDRYITRLKDAGLQTVQMGIQSGSEKTHRTIFHRSYKVDEVLSAVSVLKKHDLVCMYDFIIENDFETDEDRDKTIELMLRIPKPFIANLFAMTVFPRTDLEAMYRKRNMVPRIDPYASNYFDFSQDNFYYQLASLIPLIDENEARRIFENRHDTAVVRQLRELYAHKMAADS